jgi:hypothetical protein
MADTTDDPSAQEKLEALLRDLSELSDYLSERGRHSYELAQRFLENAQRNPASRSYDERQATMLEYQQYLWFQIAGLVNKLLVTYGAEPEALPEAEEKVDVNHAHSENG